MHKNINISEALLDTLFQLGRRLRCYTPQRAFVLGTAVTLSACAGLPFVASWWLCRSVEPYLFRAASTVPSRHVAIVPGARVFEDGTPSATLTDRLYAALELYRAGKVQKILASGDHATANYDEVNAMGRWLEAAGVPAADVFLDHAGLRTLDTMQRAKRIFKVADAVICTQRFHLPRAVFLARAAGIDAVGFVADRRVYAARHWNAVRESVARTVAVLETFALPSGPRFLGEPISIRGDGRVTRDH